ncbi:hypothetical protein JTE90_013286 [Oedothorax gibbosus]|uniref:Uncharacterized protein n=1 Tax=Oedothorax gibbosus TaxID=931172 RepID=A0AAV6VFX5_9ARAC|nr:hypothetical protein JTE90_013286 [Oedothorax gibbosus]
MIMGGMHFIGLFMVGALIINEGRTQQISYDDENQVPATNIQTTQQPPPAERRMSLEDFFLNRPQQQPEPAAAQQSTVQQILPQFQVQQTDPNSVLLTRDTRFPSQNGGIVSRLLQLRRMLRLRRWARRLSFIPRIVRLGVQSANLRGAASEPLPTILAMNRVGSTYNGEPYDPRDYVFGNKGFEFNNTPSSQEDYSKEQSKQNANGYSREEYPYYDTVNDLPYDVYDNKNTNNYRNEDTTYDNKYRDAKNSNNNDDYQSYEAAKLLQQKLLENLQQQYLNYPQSNQNSNVGSQQIGIFNSNNYPQNHQLEALKQQDNNNNFQQSNQNSNVGSQQIGIINSNNYPQNHQLEALKQQDNNNNYPQNSQREAYQQQNKQVYQNTNQQGLLGNNYEQSQKLPEINQYWKPQETNQYEGANEKDQLQKLREQHLQLQREQQLLLLLRQQQLLLDRERQLQQGGNNYQKPQTESEAVVQSYSQPQQSSYEQSGTHGNGKPLSADGSPTRIGSGGNVIGVGVNVGIKPPAIDVSVSKPVSPGIKPLPPIFNPILPKPVPAPAAQEHLVPLGILPKPLLNLNGRLFFGAEVGKGVNVGR